MGQAWGFGKYGGPEVQEFFDRPDPVPGRGEVLIRVNVAGIVDLVGGAVLRTVAPLARNARDIIAVGDASVSDLGGRFVERRLDRESLERSARLALDGVLAPVITAVHQLSDAPAALATVENGHAAGKVVIEVA
ncbi:zinc-binding dehydrogenase [Nocardia sp. FBN12]|uniref:zinc-binding dehydrogenase n=1 Tax=Nocardia sp. FBN12 TaxID=3419766 RepID=UPI003CFDBEE2